MNGFIIGLLFTLPEIVFGATAPTDFKSFVGLIVDILATLVVLVFALTFLAFIWGVVKSWIIQGGSAEGVKSGKNVVLIGIITLAIMVAIWGIIAMLQSSLFGS